MFELSKWQWTLAIVATFLVGFSKTGVPGLGILTVAIYANVFPSRASTGILLPVLIGADILAVAMYRRHAVWSHLLKLFPWVAVGIVAGFFVMAHLNDGQMDKLIGSILLVMVVFHVLRETRFKEDWENLPHGVWFAPAIGMLAGFTTMVANAAGPIMILYMLSMRLPKMEFMGTGAWYFLILNLFKAPFSFRLGLITPDSLIFDAKVLAVAVAGALVGRYVLKRIPQKTFAITALVFTVMAGLRLLLK